MLDNIQSIFIDGGQEAAAKEEDRFDFVKIGLASPARILAWTHGEVTKPETINYRTLKPERDGLFCEKIFGPAKDWECHCGKYKRVRHRGIICERCGVEVTDSKVRRHRMGHIKLAAPVCHIWYLKGIPSHLALLLDMPLRTIEDIAYYNSYVVLNPGNVEGLDKRQILSEEEYEALWLNPDHKFEAEMGAPAIKRLLADLKLKELSEDLRTESMTSTGQKRTKLIKRLRVVEAFVASGAQPSWMVLDGLPVIPPDLRPMVQLDGGRFATSDLNDLYRRVINRNNRLQRLLEMEAPDIIIRNEKRMLQEAVDALIDNGRRGRAVVGPNNRALKSLPDIIEGKQGRFRQNLLGKRVDYSGRSVIVVGPSLKLNQCGLPKEMALELFKPFVMNKLVERGIVQNIKSAKKKIERMETAVWDVLEEVIQGHPVLLNRAPTLHRLGIQAFEPVLVEGRAIQIHPLVCSAYNADFDGDQMAVHVPLSIEAQTEARLLMLATNNILLPATGRPTITPSQDMVIGCYYLTVDNPNAKAGKGMTFGSPSEAISAYQAGILHLHAPITVRLRNKERIETSVGRVIFNENLPEDFPYFNGLANKGAMSKLISRCFLLHGNLRTADLANDLKNLGFRFATQSGISVAIDDLQIPVQKKAILAKAEADIAISQKLFHRGEITEVERYNKVIDTWAEATEEVTDLIKTDYDRLNSVYMMAFSGARGNISQVRQLVCMRGLMADPSGRIIDLPIKTNFREGLNVTEYIISSYGARKGLVDTALRTADSGYLTRRLADVAQDVIVRDEDCKTERFIDLKYIRDGEAIVVNLQERLIGRFAARDVVDASGAVLVPKNEVITPELSDVVIAAGIDMVKIRSPLTCQSKQGICRPCYGWALTNNKLVDMGEAVGIIAAQSIGEPGTQLTMRTFHTGGVFSKSDNRILVKAGHAGTISLVGVDSREYRTRHGEKAMVTNHEGKATITTKAGKTHSLTLPSSFSLKVVEGDTISAGTVVAESVQELSKTTRKSVEKGFKDINADISGQVRFQDFRPEEKKDRQGVITKTANRQGVIWILGGEVYSLPSGSELTVASGQQITSGTSLARIATKTEYGGRVVLGEEKDGVRSLAVVTAELKLPTPRLLLDRKDVQLRFPDDAPLSSFTMLVQPGQRVESGSVIAEAFSDQLVTPSTGEVRYLAAELADKQVVTGKTRILFMPEETHQIGSEGVVNLEESAPVEAGYEIVPNIRVKESGFVSLENLDLSQSVTFYPGAVAFFVPADGEILVHEGQFLEKAKTHLANAPAPEGEEGEKIVTNRKGVAHLIPTEDGTIIVLRQATEFTIEPVKRFYETDATSEAIDLVPITRLLVRDGDRVKAGTSMFKVILVLKLGQPLINLGGRIEYRPAEEEEQGLLVIAAQEQLTTRRGGGSGEVHHHELKIVSQVHVKEGEEIKPGTNVAYTEFVSQTSGLVELTPAGPGETQKVLLIAAEHDVVFDLQGGSSTLKIGDAVYEGDTIVPGVDAHDAGFVTAIDKDGNVHVRRSRPYLVSPGTQLLVDDNDMVGQGEVLATLVYDEVKTGDIIQGLPRVEELLEARKPKENAILSEVPGTVKLTGSDDELTRLVVLDAGGQEHEYAIPINSRAIVYDGQIVKQGEPVTDGPINPHDILRVSGLEAVQQYLVDEVQSVYRSQGVEIADKHIEVIVRQMTRKVRVEVAGDSTFLPGEVMHILEFEGANDVLLGNGKEPIQCSPVLLGITKASLNTESFISAASFQETTRVLTEASIEGKRDWLRGLKENVIIGRLIPAGTGAVELKIHAEMALEYGS
ncbi:MAG: DNA-directed RNA polymerase subunit beta' [Candidatus Sericytochromatia bacterium]|nr:DNA-directed RNA polymerase subunit beta' [Candidatus Sericytochromatia bacterium]